MEVNCLDLIGEGYMGSMQWQLGREMGTIPAFARNIPAIHTSFKEHKFSARGYWIPEKNMIQQV